MKWQSRVASIGGNQAVGMEGVFVDAGVLNCFEGSSVRIRILLGIGTLV